MWMDEDYMHSPFELLCFHFCANNICYCLCNQDLLDALNQLEVGLKDNLKKLSSFDKYKQQVLLGHLDWSPMHKDPSFWRENINNFEENDFQVCLVLSWTIRYSNKQDIMKLPVKDMDFFLCVCVLNHIISVQAIFCSLKGGNAHIDQSSWRFKFNSQLVWIVQLGLIMHINSQIVRE